jgi:TRAP-type mannitol/chloroaromatic compound transport system substrate-binding protein
MNMDGRRSFLHRSALLAGAAAVLPGCAASRDAAVAPRAPSAPSVPITWRMGSSWPTGLPLLHESAIDFADTIGAASGGRMRIEVVDPSQHGKPAGLLKAVQDGEFELAYTTAQYYAAEVPAIDFFTAIPFGLTAVEQEGWLHEGGGQALFEQILAPRGVLPLTAGHTGIQMGGWFRKPVRNVADLRGVRIRVAGFPGRVLARVGAVPVNLPLGQIVPAFQDGRIDAADVVGPAIDALLSLARYAPHYLAPWHEPDVAMHLFIDRAKYLALPVDLQQIVRQSAQACALRAIYRAHDRNALALRTLEGQGIRVQSIPPAVVRALKEATRVELAVSARADPDSRRVIESLLAYKARVIAYSVQADEAVLKVRQGGPGMD